MIFEKKKKGHDSQWALTDKPVERKKSTKSRKTSKPSKESVRNQLAMDTEKNLRDERLYSTTKQPNGFTT